MSISLFLATQPPPEGRVDAFIVVQNYGQKCTGMRYSLSNGCVSGKRRAVAGLSDRTRSDRREHRRRSERAAKADRVPARPLSFVALFRGVLLGARYRRQ